MWKTDCELDYSDNPIHDQFSHDLSQSFSHWVVSNAIADMNPLEIN